MNALQKYAAKRRLTIKLAEGMFDRYLENKAKASKGPKAPAAPAEAKPAAPVAASIGPAKKSRVPGAVRVPKIRNGSTAEPTKMQKLSPADNALRAGSYRYKFPDRK